MEIIPAIDLREGKCVRLTQGKAGSEKIYYENPLDAVDYWQKEMGATRVHFVDLDAALGLGDNTNLILEMLEHSSAKIQIGGGIRDIEKARLYVDNGADRIVVGTKAVKNPNFIKELREYMPKEKIIISLDHIKGKVAIKGWTELTENDAIEMGKKMELFGAGAILYSSVEADGAFTGPDFENTKKMVEAVNIPVYAAGGTRSIDDLIKLKEISKPAGVIIGKAFYEGKIDFKQIPKSLFQ